MGSERPDLGSGRPNLGFERPDLRSVRSDLGSERPDLGSERPDLGSERSDLSLKGLIWGPKDLERLGGEWTHGNWRKLPYVESYVIGSSRATAQKEHGA